MILLDTNVLLAAYRADHPHHSRVRPWFTELAASDSVFTVPDVVWLGVVRIATNRRIFPIPSSVDDVFGFVKAVRALPNYVVPQQPETLMRTFERLCGTYNAAGNLAVDAFLAALGLDPGAEVVSLDYDFARFSEVRWRLSGS